MTKKASEVIEKLEQQVDFLVRTVTNQENLLKLILQRLNSINSVQANKAETFSQVISSPVSAPVSAPVSVQQTKTKPVVQHVSGTDALAMKAKHAQQSDAGSDLARQIQESSSIEEATVFAGKRRGQRAYNQDDERLISVSQELFDTLGKPIALATVKITNSLGQIIKTSRSNTKGKWIAPLQPGNYNVHILKKSLVQEQNKPVEAQYQISVLDTTDVQELESFKLES